METRRDVFQAIADPTRRAIMNLIAHRSMNLNSIAGNFDVSRPAISQHIRILIECNLISIRQQGRQRYCEAQFQKLKEVNDWVEPYKKFWNARLNKMEALLLELESPSGKRSKETIRKFATRKIKTEKS